MGCGSSAFDEAMHKPEFKEFMRQFQAMQLNKSEVRQFFNVFRVVDADGSGSVGLNEMLVHIKVEQTPFSEKIFSIFDEDRSGEIDFKEFVLALWNFCTLTKSTLDFFAFDLYDKDHSGELSASEVQQMLQDLYGKHEIKNNAQARNILNELTTLERKGNPINAAEFKQFVMSHQALLYPAFQVQAALKRKILGSGFWERHTEKRMRMSNGKFIPVRDFLLTSKSSTVPKVPIQSPGAGRDGLGDLDTVVNAGARNRRKSVAQGKTRASFADSSTKSTGLTANIDSTFSSLTESAKMRLSASLQNMHGMFASSRINSRVSIVTRASLAPPSPAKVYASPSFSLARVGSDLSTGNPSPARKASVANASAGNSSGTAAAGGISSSFVSPRQHGQREGNRRFSKEDLHDGHVVNPNLTVSGLGKIEGYSPVEAWSGEPSPGQRGSPYGTHNSSMVELFDAPDRHDGHGAAAKKRRGSVAPATGMLISPHTAASVPVASSHGHHHNSHGNNKRRGSLV